MSFQIFKNSIFIFLILLIPFFLTGCKLNLFDKTFSDKDDEIQKELVELVKKEYGHKIEVKIVNKTIGVYFPVNNLLENDEAKEKKLNEETAKKIDRVIFLTHRVALSSNKKLDFYIVIATDMKSGYALSIIGYFFDVHRIRLLDISKDEFSQRLLKGLNKNSEAINDWDGKHFKIEEIFLPNFLAAQIAQRIKIVASEKKNDSEKNKFFYSWFQEKKPNEKFEAKEIQWGLKDKIFTFVLEILDYQEKNVQETFNLILKTTAHVLRAYDFDYNAARIIIKSKNENKKIFFINKKDLELFRKGKIKIENLISE
ncbi:MAG: hypothetical protein ABH808_00790 [Candidatus Kuenenbacteria bacterium]